MIKINIDKIFEEVIKFLKKSNSLQKNSKITNSTALTGFKSPFDSVSFIELTTSVEEKVEKEMGKSFSIIINEIPEFKKNSGTIKIKDLKKYIQKKIKN